MQGEPVRQTRTGPLSQETGVARPDESDAHRILRIPRLANGLVPLTLHRLPPARRPVQITQDLAHFWQDTYYDVRKDMRGRCPKHYWPEDPLAATPTHTTKAQMDANA